MSAGDYTGRAVAAMADALAAEPDFSAWLADCLCRSAAAAGGTWALVASRPGSWESGFVLALIRGTAGEDGDLTPWMPAEPS